MSLRKRRARPGIATTATDLNERVEALLAAAKLADGRLDDEPVAFAQAIVSKAGERLRHGTTHLLVGFLGATGSGKSSLTNAIVGSEVATTGIRRPTTSSTLACVWGEDDAGPLLNWLGVSDRYQITGGAADSAELDGLVLLDVPDHDSVKTEHRLEMEQIAEHADLLVWVTDPEKYADLALHSYLRRLSHHGSAMVLVLNKVDQLTTEEAQACTDDLRRLLEAAGVDGAPILTTSAIGGADGVVSLRQLLMTRTQDQATVMKRLEADVAVAASDLLNAAAVGSGSGGQKSKVVGVTKSVTSRLAHDLGQAAGVDTVTEAVAAGYRRDAKSQTGWPFTRWTRQLRPHPLRRLHLEKGSAGRTSVPKASAAQRTRALAAIRDAADSASNGLPEPWPNLIRQAATPADESLFDRLDLAVADAVRLVRPRKPRWWQAIGVLQIVLAIAVVIGALWLLGLAVATWFQLPQLPTPSIRRIPVPTGLVFGGASLGWALSLLSGSVARVGGQRSGTKAAKQIERAVAQVADELVLGPIQQELDQRAMLVDLLGKARA